ncbi:MAG TPA: hypothetical protein VK559_03080 [Ferruginibacter sp.]|nr:hypothetical protein [Ferruginibacter sp.]
MRNLLFISMCLLSSVTYAQSNKFTFLLGPNYELPKRTEDLAFFGSAKDGIINLSLKKDELNVIRFDPKSLNQTDDKVISLPQATKNFNSETIAEFDNGNYFWIHSDWDKDGEKEYLYYDKIDVANAKFISQNNKMLEATKIVGIHANQTGSAHGFAAIGHMYDFKVIDKYKFNYSADHQKLLVSYRLQPDSKDTKETYDKIGLVVFDDNMNKIWGGEFTMPYTEAVMENSDYSIDSKGNAYMLAKVYDSDKRREKDRETGLAAYTYEVLKFTKDSKEIIHTPIGVGDYFVKEASLIESPTHDMIIASTYSKKSKGNNTDGIFLAMINQDGKVVKYKNGFYEFPVADLEKFESDRTKRKMENKDDYEAPNLQVRDIVTASDGSVFIDCEEVYEKYYSSTDSYGNTSSYVVYFYEDIIAAKIKASGDFAWVRKVPKRQKGEGTETLGFKLVVDASGYYFLFLDNKKNMDLADNEVPKYHENGAGGQVVVAKLDNDGNLSKELLFDTRDEDVMIFPTKFTQINSNQFIGRAKAKHGTFDPLLITVK